MTARARNRRRTLGLGAIVAAAIGLTACAEKAPPAPPAPARTPLAIAHEPAYADVADALAQRYAADHPDVAARTTTEQEDADLLILRHPDDRPHANLRVIERRVGVVVPADSRLRLIDLSRGDCDVVVGREGTPLGELGRATLRARGLDDQINPRLREADADDLIDRVIERDAIGLAYTTVAADRAADVRIVAEGARDTAVLVAVTPEGARVLEWLAGGVTTRRPLRTHGFDLADATLLIAPQDQP